MPHADLGKGVQIHYQEVNPQGKIPVLFCHGSGGNTRHWRFQRDLPEDLILYFVDLPGHGQSTGSALDTVAAYRETIKSLVDKLQLSSFFLAGHSLGGAIALDYARCYPEDLQGMILLSTGARLRVLPFILEAFSQDEIFPDMPHFIYGQNAHPNLIQESLWEMGETPPQVFYADFTACNHFDIMEEVPGIQVPALIIAGDEDRLTPPKYSRYLNENLPRSEFNLIEGAGHMAMQEDPGQVNEIISAWCRS